MLTCHQAGKQQSTGTLCQLSDGATDHVKVPCAGTYRCDPSASKTTASPACHSVSIMALGQSNLAAQCVPVSDMMTWSAIADEAMMPSQEQQEGQQQPTEMGCMLILHMRQNVMLRTAEAVPASAILALPSLPRRMFWDLHSTLGHHTCSRMPLPPTGQA